jgi:hypothetical protein
MVLRMEEILAIKGSVYWIINSRKHVGVPTPDVRF